MASPRIPQASPKIITIARKYSRGIFLCCVGVLLVTAWLKRTELSLWFIAHPPSTWTQPALTLTQDLIVLTTGILVEALPFILLGVGVSTLIHRFLPANRLIHLLPRQPFLRRIVLSFVGMALPVCECGNIPVARSLLQKGLSPSDVVSFLFAAPILNPITIVSTIIAFSHDLRMVWWRVIFAFIIVHITASIVSRIPARKALTPSFAASCHLGTPTKTLDASLSFARKETWQLLKMLVFGAVIAAAIQILTPRVLLDSIGTDPILSVFAMVGLGVIISICSSVDAFFALAYVRNFTTGSILSFLLAGPMIDIKMIALLRATFRPRFIALLALITIALACLVGIGVNIYAR